MAFNFFKGKTPEVKQPQEPVVNPNPVLKIGEEHTFKDPKTGEYVYQRAIGAEHKKLIIGALQRNGQCATTSIQLLRQKVAVDKAILENDARITTTEKEINDAVQKARDEMKIDGRWLLNPNIMILERRDPPEG